MVTSTDPIRVLLAEDQAIQRIGLKLVLERTGRFAVTEAEDGVVAVQTVEALQPDVVLMDIQMPNLDGIKATQEIHQSWPDIKIIMLTTFSRSEDIFACFAAGANGYCVKDIASEQLVRAIDSVIGGASWLDPAIAERVLRNAHVNAQQENVASKKSREDGFRLTERELVVLDLLVQGLTNGQIGARLFISAETVKTHVRHIMEKLSVSDRTQAAVQAMRSGLV